MIHCSFVFWPDMGPIFKKERKNKSAQEQNITTFKILQRTNQDTR